MKRTTRKKPQNDGDTGASVREAPEPLYTEESFVDFARGIFSVTPEQLQEREEEWKEEQVKKGKRGPKPKTGENTESGV